MKNKKRYTRIFLLLFLLCGGLLFATPSLLIAATPVTEKDEISNIYTLHHAVLPGILFSNNGSLFFNDLFTGKTAPFLDIVEKPLGKSYASGIKIVPEHHPGFDLVLISFPEPIIEPLCVHAALVRKGSVFRYITLEKGNDIGKTGTKTFFCEWSPEHTHKNYGARMYDVVSEFDKDIITFLKQ
ncbi:MAG: hypothetical protein FDX21_11210 [Chlorobium sp.]|nr:MAG: hypothetical protein FDX21_11210 [Chlorobium sp.]